MWRRNSPPGMRLRPHLTLLLDMDPQVSLQRVEVRNLGYGGAFPEDPLA